MNVEQLLKQYYSVEHFLFRDLQRIQQAYFRLCNCETQAQCETEIKEIRAASCDMKERCRKALDAMGFLPVHLICNWTQFSADTLDNKMLNSQHFYLRFFHSKKRSKVKELTALFYFLEELSQIAEETKSEGYYLSKKGRDEPSQ